MILSGKAHYKPYLCLILSQLFPVPCTIRGRYFEDMS